MCFSLLRLDGFGFKVTSMDILTYIKPELLILIPVLSIVGRGIKKRKVKNNRIPLILGVTSVLLSTLWVVATSEIKNIQDVMYAVFIATTQGILAAGASVYGHQLYVQSTKKE